MAQVKLIRGIVWAGKPKSPGDVIECNKKQADWLVGRGVGAEILQQVVIPADVVEPKPKRKYTRKQKEEV